VQCKRIFFWLGYTTLLVACSKELEQVQLILPEHSIVSQDRYWAVVRVPYLRLRASLEEETGEVSGILRAGDVVHILQVKAVYQSQERYWKDYFFVQNHDASLQGWLTSEVLELFLYEEAAKRNSLRFRQLDNANPTL
jgi:hypothetical protein